MKPWREIAIPHPDVLKGTFQQAEFAARGEPGERLARRVEDGGGQRSHEQGGQDQGRHHDVGLHRPPAQLAGNEAGCHGVEGGHAGFDQGETLGGEGHGAAQTERLAQVAGTEEQDFRGQRDEQPEADQG